MSSSKEVLEEGDLLGKQRDEIALGSGESIKGLKQSKVDATSTSQHEKRAEEKRNQNVGTALLTVGGGKNLPIWSKGVAVKKNKREKRSKRGATGRCRPKKKRAGEDQGELKFRRSGTREESEHGIAYKVLEKSSRSFRMRGNAISHGIIVAGRQKCDLGGTTCRGGGEVTSPGS